MYFQSHYQAEHILQAIKKRTAQKYSLYFIFSYESGILEDPANPGPDDLYQMTKDPKTAPDKPEELEITFKIGRIRCPFFCPSTRQNKKPGLFNKIYWT